MHNDVLFLTLRVFSATGGIEKVCRIAGKAIYENSIRFQRRIKVYSMHDGAEAAIDNPYFPSELFAGFNAQKFRFVRKAVQEGLKSKVILLSHINLLLPAYIIKKLAPDTKIVLLAHGIEIWDKITPLQKKMLGCCDEIVAVSQFTSDRIQAVHGIPASRCRVLNNCLDPFLPLPQNAMVPKAFYEKYKCSPEDRILFTLTRLAGTEHYKGYDKVLYAISQMCIPNLKYLLAGKYDAVEKAKLDALILELGLRETVLLPGFVPDADVASLFSMGDLYVMPSSKEGFGIVFIEAMYYGLPVIAGNADGSVDALLNGALGLLVNPQSVKEVKAAIEKILDNPSQYQPNAALLNKHFSYEGYKDRMELLLNG